MAEFGFLGALNFINVPLDTGQCCSLKILLNKVYSDEYFWREITQYTV